MPKKTVAEIQQGNNEPVVALDARPSEETSNAVNNQSNADA
jgi:hypothetical protein